MSQIEVKREVAERGRNNFLRDLNLRDLFFCTISWIFVIAHKWLHMCGCTWKSATCCMQPPFNGLDRDCRRETFQRDLESCRALGGCTKVVTGTSLLPRFCTNRLQRRGSRLECVTTFVQPLKFAVIFVKLQVVAVIFVIFQVCNLMSATSFLRPRSGL